MEAPKASGTVARAAGSKSGAAVGAVASARNPIEAGAAEAGAAGDAVTAEPAVGRQPADVERRRQPRGSPPYWRRGPS